MHMIDKKKHILKIKELIKSSDPKKAIIEDSNYILEEKEYLNQQIKIEIFKLKNILDEISPYIYELKIHIHDITEETIYSWIYLNLCLALEVWKSVLILCEHSQYNSVLVLLRTISEINMQCSLLAADFMENKKENLDKWFSGEIITHRVGREKMGNFLWSQEIDVKNLLSTIYWVQSTYAHNGYVGMLENVSPFTEDFDTNYTPTQRIYETLIGTWEQGMKSFIITLKFIFIKIIKDIDTFDKLDNILMTKFYTQ